MWWIRHIVTAVPQQSTRLCGRTTGKTSRAGTMSPITSSVAGESSAGTARRTGLTDWPTLALIAGFWIALLAIALGHAHLPTAVVVIGLAVLGGLYMSLQHEVIHGHPTPSANLNRL